MSDKAFLVVLSVLLTVLIAMSGVVFYLILPEDVEPSETSTESISLRFDGDGFEFDMDIGVIEAYDDSDFQRNINSALTSHRYAVSDSVIDSLMDVLDERMVGMSDLDKARALLDFVYINIDYKTDEKQFGCKEYTQYPSETLYNGKGDCEDMAFLLYVLYGKVGLDSILIFCNNHVAVGVDLDGYGKTVIHNFKEYTIADPTSSVGMGGKDLEQVWFYTRAENPNALTMISVIIVLAEFVIGHWMLNVRRYGRD